MREDKDLVLIYQSATFNFFKSLQYPSISFFKNDTTRNYGIIDPYVSKTMLKDSAVLSGFRRIRMSLMNDDFEKLSYQQVRKVVFNCLSSETALKHLVLVNGHTNSVLFKEIHKWWNHFAIWKRDRDVPLMACMPAHLLFRQYAILYVIMEYMVERGIQVHNIWEDPLQHKFHYMEGLKIRHYYFHKCSPEDSSNFYEHDEKLFKFRFNPSQQYYYCIDAESKKSSSVSHQSNRFLDFAFAMTDSWLDRKDRADVIQRLLPLITEPQDRQLRTLFRYKSCHKELKTHSTKLIPYEEYLDIISSSKTTMIIPSYDSRCFSLRRFFEAISRGCIPLILSTCNYKAGFSFNPEFIKLIEEHLLINVDELTDIRMHVKKIVDQYDSLYQKIRNTTLMQHYYNPRFYKFYLEQMFTEDYTESDDVLDNPNFKPVAIHLTAAKNGDALAPVSLSHIELQ